MGELWVLKLRQLGSEVIIAIIRPSVVDPAAFVDRHVSVLKRREGVQMLGVERGVVPLQPCVDGGRIRGRP